MIKQATVKALKAAVEITKDNCDKDVQKAAKEYKDAEMR